MIGDVFQAMFLVGGWGYYGFSIDFKVARVVQTLLAQTVVQTMFWVGRWGYLGFSINS